MNVQDLARALSAAGSVKLPESEEEGVYLVHVSDGNVVERFWTGTESKNKTVVAEGAKADTSASYLVAVSPEEVQRRIVFIDQSNAIQCYVCDNETEEWEDTGLGSKWSITTSPESKLSATIGPDGQAVITYQAVGGQLVGIMSAGGGEWQEFGPLEASPVAGTPQLLDVVDDKLHLFYVAAGGSIHYQALDPDTSSWQDNEIKNATFDTEIQNFTVTRDPSTGSFQTYCLTAGSLWNIDGDKEKVHLGKVEDDGKLVLADKAQAGRRTWWRGARHVRIRGNNIDIWY